MNFGNVGGKRAWLGALVSALMATPFKTISTLANKPVSFPL
jgi:hypothetical protein